MHLGQRIDAVLDVLKSNHRRFFSLFSACNLHLINHAKLLKYIF